MCFPSGVSEALLPVNSYSERFVFFSACLAASLATHLFLPAQAETDKQSAWNITYRHSYYHLCKAVLSESRANLTTGIWGFAVLPPDYGKLYVVNPSARLYLETPDKKWYDPRWLSQVSFAKYVRAGEETICGLKCAHYLCLDEGGKTKADFWTTRSIPARADMVNAFCKVCGLPTGLGVPIRYRVVDSKERRLLTSVEAVAVTKAVVPVDSFLPRSFKKAQDRYALFVSKSGVMQKSDIEDLFKIHDKKYSP